MAFQIIIVGTPVNYSVFLDDLYDFIKAYLTTVVTIDTPLVLKSFFETQDWPFTSPCHMLCEDVLWQSHVIASIISDP